MAFLLPLNSSAFLGASQANYRDSVKQIQLSTARLSSGNRLIRAGDDVAALSISTRMQTELVSLRQAQQNISQGDSLLQIAYDGLSEISDLLDSLTALATQANSGALSASERAILQTEFTALSAEIDRLAGNTSFNDLNLLDGTFSGQNSVATTTSDATKSTGSLLFTSITAGETVVLNGQTFTEGSEFAVGGDLQSTIDNLVTALNTSTNTALSGATYARSGANTLTVTQDAGGELGDIYTIGQATSTSDFTTTGGTTNTANVYRLDGGADDGLGFNTTSASGTIGDALVTTQSQTQSLATLSFTGNAIATETISIDDGSGSVVAFQFVASASTSTEITIGSDIGETIENAIAKFEAYSGNDDFGVRQLEFERDGDSLVIRSQNVGDPADVSGVALDLAEGISAASLSTTTLNSGTNTGVNVSGVENSSFVGSISGFTATYNSADNITASLTIGSSTYSATLTDTTPASDTFVRFNSTDGGYFDVEIASGGLAAADQAGATSFASRLDAAFGGLTFSQQRIASSFSGSGDLASGSASIALEDFSTVPKISDISVSAASGSNDAVIEITVDGEVFRSGDIDDKIGSRETITLTNTQNANETIKISTNNTDIDLSSDTLAATFETDLRNSFGLNASGSGVDIQIGVDATDTINLNINTATTSQLFGGVTPSILTQSDAAAAIATIATGRTALSSSIAGVGAAQARLSSAADVAASTVTNLDIARGSYADTDIAEESTIFAGAQVRNQAAIAVIAQTQQLQSGILSLLDAA